MSHSQTNYKNAKTERDSVRTDTSRNKPFTLFKKVP